MGQVVKEGFLRKPPKKWHIKFWDTHWGRRYFVIQSGNMPGECFLIHYRDETKRNPRKKIPLHNCEQVDAYLTYESRNQKITYPWIFDIRCDSKKYYFSADSEEEMNDWVSMICKICNLQRDENLDQNGQEHEYADDSYSTPEKIVDNHAGRSSSLESGSTVVSSNGSVINNSTVVISDTAISVGGGEISTRRAQGYIRLDECVSGPERPPHKTPPYSNQAPPDDGPPKEMAPALPESPWDSNSLKPSAVVHSRGPSNDSTASSSNFHQSSDSETTGPPTPFMNVGGSGASLNESYSDDNLIKTTRPLGMLACPPPPPRPPKSKRGGPLAKEPDLHSPYRNEIVMEEDHSVPSTYDRPPAASKLEFSSLPRPRATSGNGGKPSPLRPTLSPTSVEQQNQFSSLPRPRKEPGEPIYVENGDISSSPLMYSRIPAKHTNGDIGTEYQNLTLLTPPPRQYPRSPLGDKPPEVDRSLKPSRNRRTSSESTSPTMVNAPIAVMEQQPHIPPRLPPDTKKKTSTGETYVYDRPSFGVIRKESFTRRNRVQNGIGNLNRINSPLLGAAATKKSEETANYTERDNANPSIQYTEMDFDSPPTSIVHGSGSFSSTNSNNQANGGHNFGDQSSPGSARMPVDPSSQAKKAYVIIDAEKTKGFEKTKSDREHDKMYKGGTFERSQSKASVSSNHK